ncbi:MAG: hypothetical protein ACD_77C00282G0010 [uncultured bacterium]|nr:MAG: hypothetical protein ACD_77C00282G0010 [uncultured bacterium]HBY01948.1 competence protein TfoX [Rikenellaceae bacterium]
MGTTKDFALFVTEQMSGAGLISSRKMMGEYVVYLEEKVVALICDNKVFIKPTKAGRAFIEQFTSAPAVEAPPYTGAKPFFLVEEKLEDRDFLAKLLQASYKELPFPKPKKPKRPKR